MRNTLLVALMLFCFSATFSQQDWTTTFESSDGKRTARYAEVINYSQRLAEASPRVKYQVIGKSAGGYDIPMVIINKTGLDDPESVRASGDLVMLIEGGIHPGEAEGTDAILMLMRDIAITGEYKHLLENVTFIFLPAFNVDGLNRMGSYNRINQNGPEEMGWRTNTQNLNLNRDFLKADAPAMHAWLKMFTKWLPDFFIDCHTTDGADYQYVLTYMMETFGTMDPALTRWQENDFLPFVKGQMGSAGHLMNPYVSFRRWHDPLSGLYSSPAPPRLSQGYTALQNRPGLLIETHMLKPHRDRTLATYDLLVFSAEFLNLKPEKLKILIKAADATTADPSFRDRPFPLRWKRDDTDSTMVEFKGVEYDIVKSDLTGGNWFRYHPDRPKTYLLPWFNKSLPAIEVDLPEAYVIPQQWSDVIDRMVLHGVDVKYLQNDAEIRVEQYRFKDPRWSESPYEGRFSMRNIEYDAFIDTVAFRKGDAVIDMNQRTARVIVNILEPQAPDSYVYWGFFTAIFEQKEYSETYVMEEMAREMIEADPSLKEEFEALKTENPELAKNQWGLLNWFYSKTPYWDEKKNLYPVGRILDREEVELLPTR
ncbi:MAG: M14 family metallopeptidase [Bacteroidales bacterium]|jgi:murein tripeptide amidase MpaA|nr:M14 family metallopeptidase [Bacteroidales bacterium]